MIDMFRWGVLEIVGTTALIVGIFSFSVYTLAEFTAAGISVLNPFDQLVLG
jgi:hypothetical protein